MPATATREQAGIQSSTSGAPMATVVYDPATSKISLNVVISLPFGATEYEVFAIPFNIPAGTWTVQWTLEPGEGLSSVSFTETNGIVLPPDQLPPRVRQLSSQQMSDTEWQVQLTNNVMAANSFNYDIGYTATTSSDKHLPPAYVHDPTIALTPDPITKGCCG